MEAKKRANHRMKFNRSSGSPAGRTSNETDKHQADAEKVESTIAAVLKNTKVIEKYLDEHNTLKQTKEQNTGILSEVTAKC